MNNGVIYFNQGSKCLLRMIVSIHSLIKHYNGPISVISSGQESHKWCHKLFDYTNINIIEASFDESLEGKNDVYLKKASVNSWTPYDISVFLDADTLVRGNIDELFEYADKYDFVVPQFTSWTTNTKAIIRRIKGWEEAYPHLMDGALNFGKAVNCGVFAFKKNTEFAIKWCDDIKPGRCNFIPDETGMQVVLQNYRHFVCDQKFNVSCKYSNPHCENARVIHYHGRKHCRLNDDGKIIYNGDLWLDEFEQAYKINYLNIKDAPIDRMYKKYKNFKPKREITDKRITIVTAVNPPYLEKLKTTLPTWQKKPQLKDCPLVVFHNGFDNPNDDLAFIEKVSGREVKLIEWNMEKAESTRELMLSSFVLKAPFVVDTPFWLKIDADAYFCDDQDIILDHFYEHDLAGHKWKYTKSPNGESWIDRLDSWAEDKDIDGESYLNEEEKIKSYDSKRYSHKRIASFVCLHNTEFTKEAAEYADDRLPIPSHDTYMWYLAERLPDRKWCWHNFKKLGSRNHTNINKLRELVNEIQQGSIIKKV